MINKSKATKNDLHYPKMKDTVYLTGATGFVGRFYPSQASAEHVEPLTCPCSAP